MMSRAVLESKILFKCSSSRLEEKFASSCITLSSLVQGHPALISDIEMCTIYEERYIVHLPQQKNSLVKFSYQAH